MSFRLPLAITTFALVCAITLAANPGFAAPADENDEAAPSDDCGEASNCGGIGGWRVILLAKDADDAAGESSSESEPVEDPEEPVDNLAPGQVGSIDDQELTVGGESATVDVAPFFSDPDGDELTYVASSSDEQVATASASGSSVTVAPVAAGTATITVTARDPGGLTAEQTFGVNVTAASEDSYCRPEDVLEPGDSCDIYGTNIDFSVNSSGLGCVLAAGITLCQGADIDHSNRILNGESYRLRATRDGNSWTIEEVSPEPPD